MNVVVGIVVYYPYISLININQDNKKKERGQ